MKIAFIFGAFSIGTRPLDFNHLMTSSRGLTGSELGCVMMAKEMKLRGHDVSIFTIYCGEPKAEWEGIKLYHYNERSLIQEEYDAVISWNEPDPLREVSDKPIRVVSQQ